MSASLTILSTGRECVVDEGPDWSVSTEATTILITYNPGRDASLDEALALVAEWSVLENWTCRDLGQNDAGQEMMLLEFQPSRLR